MSAPTSSGLQPADLSTLADVSAPSVVWTEDPLDPIDLAEFTFEIDGRAVAAAYTPLGGGDFRAYALAVLVPDQAEHSVTAGAKSESAAAASVMWSFTTRGPMGEAKELADSFSGAASRRELAEIFSPVLFIAARSGALAIVSAPIATRDIADLFVTVQSLGSDTALAHLVRAELFQILLSMQSIQSGIPQQQNASPHSVEVKGRAQVHAGLQNITVQGERDNPVLMLLEVAVPATVVSGASLEVSSARLEGRAATSLEVEEGSGPDVEAVLLDSILSAVRE